MAEDHMAAARQQLPPDWRERHERKQEALRPEPGTGWVTVLPPGHRRPWSAAWSTAPDAEPGEYFDAETFREVLEWAFARTRQVRLRERTGEYTPLAPLPGQSDGGPA